VPGCLEQLRVPNVEGAQTVTDPHPLQERHRTFSLRHGGCGGLLCYLAARMQQQHVEQSDGNRIDEWM